VKKITTGKDRCVDRTCVTQRRLRSSQLRRVVRYARFALRVTLHTLLLLHVTASRHVDIRRCVGESRANIDYRLKIMTQELCL